jgi:hypothetical protein
LWVLPKAVDFGLVPAEHRNPGGNALGFEQGIVYPVSITRVRSELAQRQVIGEQTLGRGVRILGNKVPLRRVRA